ncbi:MAG: histidine kinase dimerization/phospho-acceptor domain-containing protein, partial [Thermomonas sp.]
MRQRSTLAFTLMGFVLSALFALATSWAADDYESTMVAEILKSQAEDYGARLAIDPDITLPRTRRLSGYLRRGSEAGNIPVVYAGLQPGFHEADRIDGSEAHIGVFDTVAGRLVFVIDVSAIESFERHLNWMIAAVLVLGTALSGWLGWIFAGGVLRPVRALANAVDALPTQPKQTELAGSISDDALGRLAGAIDRYQSRLVAADAYERDFYADASHELRTPITVVRGVADVLVDDPSVDAGMRRRLRRLDRGVRELTDLLDLLFGMARRRTPQSETVSATALIQAAASSLSGDQDGGGVLVDVDVRACGSLCVPWHEGLLLLRAAI